MLLGLFSKLEIYPFKNEFFDKPKARVFIYIFSLEFKMNMNEDHVWGNHSNCFELDLPYKKML